MSALPDDLPMSEINIPGSHNSAAINPTRPTRWACQDRSITDQLNHGIRLLDIRLKPKKRDNGYEFITCHGRLGLVGANEFQSFDEVQYECTTFLKSNPSETIILTIQIDDWRGTRKQDHPQLIKALETTLSKLPRIATANIPTLKESRGKLYLFNRINDNPALGVPLTIPNNTPGAVIAPAKGRNYEVYVQDQYKRLDYRSPEAHKLRLTIAALGKKRPGMIVLNYASATKPIGRFVSITKELLPHLAKQETQRTGWLFLDYALTTYKTNHQETLDLPALLIASNFAV